MLFLHDHTRVFPGEARPPPPVQGFRGGGPHLGEYRTQVWLVVFIPSAQWLVLTRRACDPS